MRIAVYPGSFDPVTNGHIDILNKTSKLFDKVIVAVVHNVSKTALFSPEERSRMIIESTEHLDNIEVECFNGLLANFVTGKGACAIIRGLRTGKDFEYEMHMAWYNKIFVPEIETIFVISNSNNIYVSSSGVKEAALLGGDVSSLVPPGVKKGLEQKLGKSKR